MKLELPERKAARPPPVVEASPNDAQLPAAPDPAPLGSLDPIIDEAVSSQPILESPKQPEPQEPKEPQPTPPPRNLSFGWIMAGLAGVVMVAAAIIPRQPVGVSTPSTHTPRVHHGPAQPQRIVIE